MKRIAMFFVLILLLPTIAIAVELAQPGDTCQKEGVDHMVPCGMLTCVGGKYVATMIGPSCNVGSPCQSRDKSASGQNKSDKWGMICQNGKTAFATKSQPGEPKATLECEPGFNLLPNKKYCTNLKGMVRDPISR